MCRQISNLIILELFSLKTFILLSSHLQNERVVGHSKREFSEKLFWTQPQQHLNIPKGFTLTFTSSADIPLWSYMEEALSSTMKFEVPFKLQLDKLFNGNIFQKRTAILSFQPRSTSENLRSKRQVDNNNITDIDESSFCSLGQKQRIKILKKLESALSFVGLKGGPCLLRAICEFQEFTAVENYGLFGEIAKLLFSMKDNEGVCRNDFIIAEERGRSFKCSEYRKLCSKSLFTWKTNYLPYFSGVL